MKGEQDLHVFPGGLGDPNAGPYGVKASGAGFWGPQEKSKLPSKWKKEEIPKVDRNESLLSSHQEEDPYENWELEPISASNIDDSLKAKVEDNSSKNKRYTTYDPQHFVSEHKTQLIT
jgi:hypothetical protein